MATITITTAGGAQDARIAAAVGQAMGLGVPAQIADVKQWLIDQLRRCVHEAEASAARLQAEQSVTDISAS